jgi:hypothetical protein
MVTGGYHTGYSHLSQQSPDHAVLSWTSEKHMGNASSVMSQQYKNMDRQGTSSLLTTQQKDDRPALSMLPTSSNYGISQSSIYSWPDHSFSANKKNSVNDQNLR